MKKAFGDIDLNWIKIMYFIFISAFAFLISGCCFKIESDDKLENKEIKEVSVIINNQNYKIYLENNETVDMFLQLLPLDIKMSELNGNEKYKYLDESLPTDSKKVKRVNAGDIMLYGDNCLVIFYKSFDTSYSYTKIGHIDKLPDLGDGDISVKFIIDED